MNKKIISIAQKTDFVNSKSTLLIFMLISAASQATPNTTDNSIYPHLFIGVKSGYQLNTTDSFDQHLDNMTPIGAFSGSQITKNWSWDIGYQYHGELTSDYNPYRKDVGIFETGIRYDWYLFENLSFYGRVALAYWDINDKNNIYSSDDGFSPLSEFGVNYLINPKLYFNFGYQNIQNLGDANIGEYNSNSLFLGVTYHFKGKEQAVQTTVKKEVKETIPTKVIKLYETSLAGSVAFAFDSSEVQQSYRISSELKKFIKVMNEYPQAHAEIAGHTDSIGSSDYNNTLSKKRAIAIYELLKDSVINPERVKVIGYGESKPIAGNETEKGRAENRRVELTVLSFEYE